LENTHVCAIYLFETKRVGTIETRQRPLNIELRELCATFSLE
jgi:hypothetical protein